MSRAQIETLLPHREPFLFLDEIIEITENGLTAKRVLRNDEFYFSGHYPQSPIMPGVLLCEAVLQAGAAFIAHSAGAGLAELKDKIPVVTRLRDAKFKVQVHPGDELLIEVELDKQLANAYFMTGKVKVKDKVAVRLEFTVAAVDASE